MVVAAAVTVDMMMMMIIIIIIVMIPMKTTNLQDISIDGYREDAILPLYSVTRIISYMFRPFLGHHQGKNYTRYVQKVCLCH